jgi:hypothetical protein
VSAAVVIAFAKSLPFILLLAPKTIVVFDIRVPLTDELAPVVKLAHSQNISQTSASLVSKISTPAAVDNAPTALKT